MFESGHDALVNTVNCVGIMGKGVALQCKLRYPENYLHYRAECMEHNIKPGSVHCSPWNDEAGNIPKIYNVATKDHWRDPSRLEWIDNGLDVLAHCLQRDRVKSVDIPPLGCGNGGLNWADVHPLIISTFENMDIDAYVYAPA